MAKDASIEVGSFIAIGEPPLPDHIEEREVSFSTEDGATVKGILCQPKNIPVTQKALFLYEIEGHTNGGSVTVISRRYADLGIASLRIDFSGHGKRKDEWERYSPQSMLHDATVSLNWLDEEFPEIDKTMLCGFSTGGGIAILLREMDDRISKSCLLYPVLSFKNNFIAAAYDDEDLLFPLELWDGATPWRAHEFTKEKLEASLKKDKPFSLSAHTYGANFIKGCKEVSEAGDITRALLNSGEVKSPTPLTVIQGTHDICVPHPLARIYYSWGKAVKAPFRLVSMKYMDHFVAPQWKKSVLHQFRKAALQSPEEFKPNHTVVSLRPQKKGFLDLETQLRLAKDLDHVRLNV